MSIEIIGFKKALLNERHPEQSEGSPFSTQIELNTKRSFAPLRTRRFRFRDSDWLCGAENTV